MKQAPQFVHHIQQVCRTVRLHGLLCLMHSDCRRGGWKYGTGTPVSAPHPEGRSHCPLARVLILSFGPWVCCVCGGWDGEREISHHCIMHHTAALVIIMTMLYCYVFLQVTKTVCLLHDTPPLTARYACLGDLLHHTNHLTAMVNTALAQPHTAPLAVAAVQVCVKYMLYGYECARSRACVVCM